MNHIDAMKLAALNTTESDCGSRAWEREQEAITALREALAEQPAQGCNYCNHALYSGTKCKNCGLVAEQAAIKRGLTPGQPAQQQEPKTKDVVIANMGKPFTVKAYVDPQPAQRTWVGLTHDEYDAICDKHSAMSDFDFLEDIEAKLKEKNT